MSRARQTFQQRDVGRMVTGVVAAGVDVREVSASIVPDGTTFEIDERRVL